MKVVKKDSKKVSPQIKTQWLFARASRHERAVIILANHIALVDTIASSIGSKYRLIRTASTAIVEHGPHYRKKLYILRDDSELLRILRGLGDLPVYVDRADIFIERRLGSAYLAGITAIW